MKLSKVQQTKLRKYVPLVVLYPVSTGLGVLSTIYVANILNRSYPTYSNSGAKAADITPTTQSLAATEASPQQREEQQRIARLQAQIAQLKGQIQQLTGAASAWSAPQITGGSQSSPPVTRSQSNPPRTVATAPPPTHGSTGASRALG